MLYAPCHSGHPCHSCHPCRPCRLRELSVSTRPLESPACPDCYSCSYSCSHSYYCSCCAARCVGSRPPPAGTSRSGPDPGHRVACGSGLGSYAHQTRLMCDDGGCDDCCDCCGCCGCDGCCGCGWAAGEKGMATASTFSWFISLFMFCGRGRCDRGCEGDRLSPTNAPGVPD